MAATTAVQTYELSTGLSTLGNAPFEWKEMFVETANTADSTNTIAIDASAVGIATIKFIAVFIESTAGVVIANEAPTTTVSGTTITVTLGGSAADNLKRYIRIGGY